MAGAQAEERREEEEGWPNVEPGQRCPVLTSRYGAIRVQRLVRVCRYGATSLCAQAGTDEVGYDATSLVCILDSSGVLT
eukprot:891170-Rhodomonas_salina.2